MDTRMKKHREVSPGRAKVWREISPKYQQMIKKVPVVYYLRRSCQLEHPHFMEVPLSSPEGLYLRDVIERLDVLRGRGMASMYAWSSKRSYRNGFVWHDLCVDDLITPAIGNEYVLKGSELFYESNSDHFSPIVSIRTQNLKQLPEPPSSSSQDDTSSSSSMNRRGTKHSQEPKLSPDRALRSGSSDESSDFRDEKNSPWAGSSSSAKYNIYKSEGLADASTQTEEHISSPNSQQTCTRGVSTDDRSSEPECTENQQTLVPCLKNKADVPKESVSPPFPSSASSLGAKTETLETLIRADAGKINSFRSLERDEAQMRAHPRLKATNMLMQLISCGSISVNDNNSFGLVPTYGRKVGHSPFFSTSFMLGELDCLAKNPGLMALRLEDKEYFSGSLVETEVLKDGGDGGNAYFKHSSSYNYNLGWTSKQLDSTETKDDPNRGGSKCIPRSIKGFISNQPRSESMRYPVSDKPRSASDCVNNQNNILGGSKSNGGSRRITKSSKRTVSFSDDAEKVIKIEES